MMALLRIIIQMLDFILSIPMRLFKLVMIPLEMLTGPGLFQKAIKFGAFYFFGAFFLVYAIAPIWGWAAHSWWESSFDYFEERSRGTAIYDSRGEDMGIFDPRLDSQHDLNLTGKAIQLDEIVAFPDHKSLHVSEVPDYYWKCLQYHEDRYFGGKYKRVSVGGMKIPVIAPNPYGIDLIGVLKMPLSYIPFVKQAFGGRSSGGSTLAMQLSRSYYSTLPSSKETWIDKIKRKVGEWALAPVLQRHLRGEWVKKADGSMGWSYKPMKRWVANHLPLAQRAAGSLYGVELTSRIVFGKPASRLSPAEQFVLASAVNKPIIVLEGGKRVNKLRLRNWQYITRKRARQCATILMGDADQGTQLTTFTELDMLGDMMPVARLSIENVEKLNLDPRSQRLVGANPVIRANVLLPTSRFQAKAEIKDIYGLQWRKAVKGVHLTLDAVENHNFRQKLLKTLGKVSYKYRRKLDHEFSLDVLSVRKGREKGKRTPDIIVAAANSRGEIIRIYEANQNAHYFGSSSAVAKNGRYTPEKEGRQIASIAKMIGAVAISNEGKDTLNSKYLDTESPSKAQIGTCRRRKDNGRRDLRRAETVFACSISNAVGNRLVKFGQGPLQHLVESFGLNMPYSRNELDKTPASTAIAYGYLTGSPRKVHHLASVILASVRGRGENVVRMPHIIRKAESTSAYQTGSDEYLGSPEDIIPNVLIKKNRVHMLRNLLSAPFCYRNKGKKEGTLKSLSQWCAARRKDVNIHIAKTGTQVGFQSDQTVDVWIAGGIEFANNQAYSYVILVGSGNPRKPLGRQLHSSQIATPLLKVLLEDLKQQAIKDGGQMN